MRKYELAFKNNDKEWAKQAQEKISEVIKKSSFNSPYGIINPPIDWKTICEIIGYPNDPFANKEKVMSSHFSRVLTDIKILSIWGKHTFPYKF